MLKETLAKELMMATAREKELAILHVDKRASESLIQALSAERDETVRLLKAAKDVLRACEASVDSLSMKVQAAYFKRSLPSETKRYVLSWQRRTRYARVRQA